MTLRLLDLFSGIGGFSYAAERLVGGYETVAFVEREPFCQSVLRKHWPIVPIHDDICKFQPKQHSADVICGGFPCQDISTAGKQEGIKEGTRSGLFFELMRVVRLVEPRYIVLENVSAILANGLDTVLGELAEAGFDAEWACIPASAVGACHQRERWWLVAYASDAKRREISPERCSKERPERVQGRQEIPSGSAESHAASDVAYASGQGLEGAWSRRPIAHALNPAWQQYVSKPVLRRGDDGLPGRVDRLKALGNAVVPQVAAIPLQRVIEIHAQT